MERRRAERLKIHQQARIGVEGQTLAVVITNISATGVCFHCRRAVPERGTLHLSVPGQEAQRHFETVYCEQVTEGQDYTVGARFDAWPGETDPVLAFLRYLQAKEQFEGRKFDPKAKPYFGDRAPT